jgi:hypothetical protein
MAPSPRVPFYYRLFFTWLDPIICVWGAYMDFFTPKVVLSSHIPNPAAPDIGHAMILKQRGGGMLNFAVLSAVLLRYTSDIEIWRIAQAAFLLVDISYFWSVYEVLESQGRLGWETWRAEDWGSLVIVTAATVTRVAFLAGLGLRYRESHTKKN